MLDDDSFAFLSWGTAVSARRSSPQAGRADVARAEVSPLPRSPEIGSSRGERSGAQLLWVDGLGVAAVDDSDHWAQAAADLLDVMKAKKLDSGSLLVSSRIVLAAADRDFWASEGISVRSSQGNDLISTARQMLKNFWDRRLIVQERIAGI